MAELPPLAGMTVVEIGGGIPAGFCARQLRGFGARRIRVEVPADGDLLDPDETAFLVTGAERVALADVDLAALVASADVLIEDQAPGWLAANGLDPLELRQRHPQLIITSITPFGQTGPRSHWRTTPAVQFAAGSLMSLTGEPYRSPLVTGGSQAFFLGGLHAFAATTALLLGRGRTSRGEWLDLSMQECAASMPELYGAQSEYSLQAPVTRLGNSVRATWGVYRCADGFGGVCCLERQAPAFLRLFEDGVATDERFVDPLIRAEHNDELLAHVMSFMIERTKDELVALSPVHRVPFGAVRTPRELLADEAYALREFFDDIGTADTGPIRVPGRPFPGLGWVPASSPTPDATRPTIREPEVTGLPLAGLRVLDLTMMWAGPYATKLLAELGAEIVKIESPSAWDNIRTLVPQDPSIPDPWNSAYYFNEYNHSKKSLTLDLAQPAGREVFLRLVADADVVIENYRADVMDNLGLTDEVLRAANNDLVLVSMAGFGKNGPLRNHVGFGPIIEMMSGLMSLTGYGDDDVPVKSGISYGDPVGGLNAVAAVALSLIARDRFGTGRHVDLAQRETASVMAGPAFVAAARGEDPGFRGNRHPGFAPQGSYPAGDPSDDRWVVLSVRTDEQWSALADLVGRRDLASLDLAQRHARQDELDTVISDWTNGQEPEHVADRCQAAGIPASVVVDTHRMHDDTQLHARGFWRVVPNEKMHPYRQSGPTWRRVTGTAHEMVRSPWFGEHNLELLTPLGLGDRELAALAEAGVIADAPINPGVG
ncbi:MAG: CoA transferase [Actinomycetota bacterium]|nr:CoA transferase [Actinomycetota bacterium]